MKMISRTMEMESQEFGIHGELILDNIEDFSKSGRTISNLLRDVHNAAIDVDQTIYNLEGTYLTGMKIDFSRPINTALARKAVYNEDATDDSVILVLKTILVAFIRFSGLDKEYTKWRHSTHRKYTQHKDLIKIRDLIS